MGVPASKPARAAPVRYVARVLPKHTTVEDIFKKQVFSAKGINNNTEEINTVPTYYTETERDANSTQVPEQVSPRWYLNTFMEMMDGTRQERVIITGNLPIAWERDKFEPYALVRNRIDDDDAKWLLSEENKKVPLEQLRESTKLEAQVVQDILDSVELPRMQYRNHKGKLTKAVPDANEFMVARKAQAMRSKEAEKLKAIGYSAEEIASDEQYLTKRSRGVKTLDDLGVSHRHAKTTARVRQTAEMEELLEARRIKELESGRTEISPETVAHHLKSDKRTLSKEFLSPIKLREPPRQEKRIMFGMDGKHVKSDVNLAKIHWWLEQSRRISRAQDKIHGVQTHNKNMQMNQEQFDQHTLEAVDRLMAARMGEAGPDPRSDMDLQIKMMRATRGEGEVDSVDVTEPDEEPLQHQFVHTRHHKKRSEEAPFPRDELPLGKHGMIEELTIPRPTVVKDEKVERDIDAWLRSKYVTIEESRQQIVKELEIEMRGAGKDWDENAIDDRLRHPIKLDRDGHLIRPAPPPAAAAGEAPSASSGPSSSAPPSDSTKK